MANEKQDDFSSTQPNVDAFVGMVEEIIPRLEEYRAKNVNKYWREKELEYSDYIKREKYKHRVRWVDCFLDPLKNFLVRSGVMIKKEAEQKDIP
jgi:hypothetical protein